MSAGETYKDELQDSEEDLIKDTAEGQASDAQIQNIIFKKNL